MSDRIVLYKTVGAPGFEPELHAPKACMLPLHHAPIYLLTKVY